VLNLAPGHFFGFVLRKHFFALHLLSALRVEFSPTVDQANDLSFFANISHQL
jgi:hypothetical protein